VRDQEAQEQHAGYREHDQLPLADRRFRRRPWNSAIDASLFSSEGTKNAVHSRDNSTVAVALLQQWRRLVANDPRCLQIGELPFQAIPDLDPHATILGQDEDPTPSSLFFRPMPQSLNVRAAHGSSDSLPIVVPIQTMTWWPVRR
jgi:hypothetical protein